MSRQAALLIDITTVQERASASRIRCLLRVAFLLRKKSDGDFPRFGGHSASETPGPIPNPEVKHCRANGTWA